MITYQEYERRSKNVKCLVYGDLMLDKYIYGSIGRISPEAPVPVVLTEREEAALGGAANVAGNIRAMGIQVSIIGRIGNDAEGFMLNEKLEAKGIQFQGIKSDQVQTTTKTRVIGMNQQILRVDKEDAAKLDGEGAKRVWDSLEYCISRSDVLIISDYNKGTCTDEICRKIIGQAHRQKKIVLVDAKAKDWTKYEGADLITPNFKEFKEAVGTACSNTEEDIVKYGLKLCHKYSLNGLLITRSQLGMTYVGRDGSFYTYQAQAREVFDVSGAGDTVMAVLAAFLSVHSPLDEAVYASNTAAGIAVGRFGAYNVLKQELFTELKKKENRDRTLIWSWEEAAAFCRQCNKCGEKVVFTNGCFDILHRGHIEYLNKARDLGERLIVGLNTDDSVKRLKGACRPVNNQADRAYLLSALECVDGVVLFDEDTPYRLIECLKPDLLVKGGDYELENIVGRNLVDEVVILPFVDGYSTTKILRGGVSEKLCP